DGPDGEQAPSPIETLNLTPADTLALAGATAKGIAAASATGWERFAGRQFDNGTFWEAPENNNLGSSDRSSMLTMVQEMRIVRKALETDFARHKGLPPLLAQNAAPFVRRLLILTLMVRFMEERGIIPNGYFTNNVRLDATDFKSLLAHPTALLRALDRLSDDFNGDIFAVTDLPFPGAEREKPADDEGPKERISMRQMLQALSDHPDALVPMSNFASGRMKGAQQYFWQRYSFRHLPVEAISYVYEDFLGGKSQSIYTPHHLVDLLLDETMNPQRVSQALRQNDPRGKSTDPCFPVLDPACGSGVFLVGAWQRLVEALRLVEAAPAPDLLKRLMMENIHGVDIEPDSVELTIFSLCVALCSTFPQKSDDPEFILKTLQRLKFPNLKSEDGKRRNIHCRDFFVERAALIKAPLRFQVIIGNPPFNSKLTPGANVLDAIAKDEDDKIWEPMPDDNIGYLFLRAVPPLLQDGGRACMVQNAGLLYNEKPASFRKALFENWHVPAVFDFASISGLFKSRKPSRTNSAQGDSSVLVKTVAVVVIRQEPDPDRPVLHATFRRTAALEEREVFEIDQQDIHWVPRHVAATEPRVWKANLLGGGRLLDVYLSLTKARTLQEFAKQKEKEGWNCREGFIEGVRTHEHKHRSKWKLLPTELLVEDNTVDEAELEESGITHYERPRRDELFTPPHLLVKEHESFPLLLRLHGERLLFRHKIVGFAAPDSPQSRAELESLHRFLKDNREATQFFAAFGPQYLIFRMGTPLKASLMSLPYPESGQVLFSGIHQYLRDDVLAFMIPLIKDTQEKRPELAEDSGLQEVAAYKDIFVKILGSVFGDLKACSETHDLGRAWCVEFYRGDKPAEAFGDTAALKEHLEGLIVHDMGRALRCLRIVRHFRDKSIYVLKPKPRRYWLKSAAVRDADDMFAWWGHEAVSEEVFTRKAAT
ncbi:MAG: HsdM family class I SAM-dependent methyltransferase, partial [Prosthecobacter sp.]